MTERTTQAGGVPARRSRVIVMDARRRRRAAPARTVRVTPEPDAARSAGAGRCAAVPRATRAFAGARCSGPPLGGLVLLGLGLGVDAA